jgi:nicotinate-nucleotide adenylyltransferase
MRIAVYGGSFNPPHRVHGEVADHLLSTDVVDEVWLLPVYQHAFEGLHEKRLAEFSERVRWCRALASDTHPRVKVCEVESTLPVPSFTIDTLRYLSEQHPEHQFRLVVGADVLSQTESWRNWAGIQESYSPIIVGREGHAVPEGALVFAGVSSTEVRQRLRAGEPVAHLLTPGVARLLAQSAKDL